MELLNWSTLRCYQSVPDTVSGTASETCLNLLCPSFSMTDWFKLYFICIIYVKYTKQHRVRLQYNHYTNGIQKKVK